MYKLEVHPFRVWFHLGMHATERVHVQPVDISVDIEFKSMPQGCITDEISDTVDYTNLIAVARELALRMEFGLIEHLGHTLYNEFKKLIAPDIKFTVKVHKLVPPFDGITNGVTFVYGS